MRGDKRHIALVIRLLGGRYGGAERMFCATANLFAAAGHRVTVLYCDASVEPLPYPLSPGVHVVNLTSRRGLVERAARGVARGYPAVPALAPFEWLAKHGRFARGLVAATRELRPDVIVSFLPSANTPSLIAGWVTGVPVIPTNHNVPAEDYESTERWDQNPFDRRLRRELLVTAARIHVLFPGFASWFPDALQARIVAIPNYVAADFLAPMPGLVRRRVIVSAGRLMKNKAHASLVEAFARIAARHPDWSVVIYGDGPERGALEQQIHALGLDGRVTLGGRRADLARAFREAELCCHPAEYEGFGLAAAEALACGLPVVAFADCEGVRELVHDGDNGLLVERTAAALGDGLSRLITDAPLRERLRARAPASIAAYSEAAYRERWLALLEDVLAA